MWKNGWTHWEGEKEKYQREVIKLKDTLRGVYSRRDEAEESITELRDRVLAFTQTEQGRKKQNRTPKA